MKKTFFATAMIAVIAFASCTSSPKAPATTGADELDIAIREASDYLNDNIPAQSKIVILNINSESDDLSSYIIDELIANAVNDKIFEVVDRAQLDLIRAEQNFQFSGEVDDSLALDIGKFFGAQSIVSGTLGKMGSRYRLTLRALEVQTARVQGQFNRNIETSRNIAELLQSGSKSGGTATAAGGRTSTGSGTTQTATPAQPAAPTYKIGDTGPAGGLIFYDKGNSQGGWRYLEAAPADNSGSVDFAPVRRVGFPADLLPRETIYSVGRGKENSEALIGWLINNQAGGYGWALRVCNDLVINGFDDWFLPSRDELGLMYGNLHLKELGDFKLDWYWSSSIVRSGRGGSGLEIVQAFNFSNGQMFRGDGYNFWLDTVQRAYIRAARRF